MALWQQTKGALHSLVLSLGRKALHSLEPVLWAPTTNTTQSVHTVAKTYVVVVGGGLDVNACLFACFPVGCQCVQ
mgnify:CR=1 FL=1